MTHFSPTTHSHLRCYVYALVYPNGGKIFYIGKGQGDRAFDHARDALNPAIVTRGHKLKIIRGILAKGQEPEILILRHGLTDKEAKIVESVFIDLFTNPLTSSCCRTKITNIQGGLMMRELGIKRANEVEAQYGCTPLSKVTDKLVVININKTYKELDIYNATRKGWRLDKKRADAADYILSEYKGVIRAVFEMDSKKWQPIIPSSGKYQSYFFTGHEVKDPVILARYINKCIKKSKGQANPIQYINL